nr:hypothetical protein [Tanacetum cinerariifolium]
YVALATIVSATLCITSAGVPVDNCLVMSKDYRMVREINRVCGELNGVIEERSCLLEELDILVGWLAPEKMVEFLKEIQRNDEERVLQLQILGSETQLRACEKDLFIWKLKGLIPF